MRVPGRAKKNIQQNRTTMSSNGQRPVEPVANVNDVSRISLGSCIKGEISSPYDIRIDGCFEGKVCSRAKVVVGEKAVIKGDIICNNVDFWGKIDGNFYVKDTLSLKATCEVTGDLHIKRLQVDLDAKFNGNCKMITEQEFSTLTQKMLPEGTAESLKPVAPVQKAPEAKE